MGVVELVDTAACDAADCEFESHLSPQLDMSGVIVPCTHFVGFRGDEYHSAVRIWGRPDFFHRHWDNRVPGDVALGDTVVFAKGTDQDKPVPFTFNDSEVM